MTSSMLMAVALAAVTPVCAPPVAARMPSGLPVPFPVKNASSSAAPMRPREFAGDIGRHVEGGVVEQLLGHLNHGGQLVGADGHLTKGVVAFGIGTFLVDPRGGAVGGDPRESCARRTWS